MPNGIMEVHQMLHAASASQVRQPVYRPTRSCLRGSHHEWRPASHHGLVCV